MIRKKDYSLFIVAIFAIVAIVTLFWMVQNSQVSSSEISEEQVLIVDEQGNIVGMGGHGIEGGLSGTFGKVDGKYRFNIETGYLGTSGGHVSATAVAVANEVASGELSLGEAIDKLSKGDSNKKNPKSKAACLLDCISGCDKEDPICSSLCTVTCK